MGRVEISVGWLIFGSNLRWKCDSVIKVLVFLLLIYVFVWFLVIRLIVMFIELLVLWCKVSEGFLELEMIWLLCIIFKCVLVE